MLGYYKKYILHLLTPSVQRPPCRAFMSSKTATITLESYLDRLCKWMCVDTEGSLLHCIVLIERSIHQYHVTIHYTTVHRILFALLLLSVKMHEDEIHSMSYYAKCGGVTRDEANGLELEMLRHMKCDVAVIGNQSMMCERQIIQWMMLQQDLSTVSMTDPQGNVQSVLHS